MTLSRYVFKHEQEEYTRERIRWDHIDFNDNQACVELIEAVHTSVIKA